MAKVDVPVFKIPFEFVNGKAKVLESDSFEEIEQCIHVVLDTDLGARIEVPEFGLEDQAFKRTADIEQIKETLAEWEERAPANVELDPDQQVTVTGYLDVVRIQLREESQPDG